MLIQTGFNLLLEESSEGFLAASGRAGGLVALEGELGLWQKCRSPGTSLRCSWRRADGRDEHLPGWDALGLL